MGFWEQWTKFIHTPSRVSLFSLSAGAADTMAQLAITVRMSVLICMLVLMLRLMVTLEQDITTIDEAMKYEIR